MDHKRTNPLLASYALGAIPDDECREIEAHVADCPACRSQLCEFQDAAAQLIDAVSVPNGVDQEVALARTWDAVRRQLHAGNA